MHAERLVQKFGCRTSHGKRIKERGRGRSLAACAVHRTRRRALEHSADYAAASAADSGSGSSRTLRIIPAALCFSDRSSDARSNSLLARVINLLLDFASRVVPSPNADFDAIVVLTS